MSKSHSHGDSGLLFWALTIALVVVLMVVMFCFKQYSTTLKQGPAVFAMMDEDEVLASEARINALERAESEVPEVVAKRLEAVGYSADHMVGVNVSNSDR